MPLFERVHTSFAGVTEWLSSEPVGPAELRGHVVLDLTESPRTTDQV